MTEYPKLNAKNKIEESKFVIVGNFEDLIYKTLDIEQIEALSRRLIFSIENAKR